MCRGYRLRYTRYDKKPVLTVLRTTLVKLANFIAVSQSYTSNLPSAVLLRRRYCRKSRKMRRWTL